MAFRSLYQKFFMISLFLLTGFFSSAQTTKVDSIISGGIYRKFRVYTPAIYSASKPAPLLIDMHGYTSNAVQQQVYSNFMPIADTAGFLLVYPDGTNSLGGPFWNAGITSTPNDVQFINELISHCQLNYAVDYNRVYSCGMSNGAIMSYYLACNLPNRITAIASVTGTMFNDWYGSCSPSRAIPVMEIHGTGDGTVPYNGDTNFAPIDSVIKKWVKHNNCTATPVTFTVPNSSTSDNSYAVNYRYVNGTNGSSVELYKVFGGSHSWPGAFPVFANTNQDFSASVQIWRFFSQYRLKQFVLDAGLNDNALKRSVTLYPNPSSEVLHVQGLDGATYIVFDVYGIQRSQEMWTEKLDVSGIEPGIYFLQLKKDDLSATIRFVKY